jgi:hypothetical protein
MYRGYVMKHDGYITGDFGLAGAVRSAEPGDRSGSCTFEKEDIQWLFMLRVGKKRSGSGSVSGSLLKASTLY